MIASVLDGQEAYFNPCSGKVEDSTSRRYLVSVSDISVLTIAEDIKRSINPLTPK